MYSKMDVFIASIIGAVIVWFVFFRRHGRGPRKYIIRKKGEYDFGYEKIVLKSPPLRGYFIKLGSQIANSIFGHVFLCNLIAKQTGMHIFRTIKFSEHPTFYPDVQFDGDCAMPGEKSYTNDQLEKIIKLQDNRSSNFKFHSMSDILQLYRSEKLTPTEVAERALLGIKEIAKTNAIVKYDAKLVRESAAASTERYKNNSTLSPIDGILVVIKDEYSVKGFRYSCGTSFLRKDEIASCDSDVISKLRDTGAIILAVAHMHELGLGTSGNNANPGFGVCRNPYNINHYTGGSSSGSAAAVAAGLCSMGLGTDGGGSIRIPSSYCGVVGLKPTFARINLSGVSGLSNSVGHSGPICTNVRDAALFYALLTGPHPGYPLGMRQPKIKLPTFDGDLSGLKIGIDRRYFKDCKEDVFKVCDGSLRHLVECGATVETIRIPEMKYVAIAHLITILSEMTTGLYHGFDFNFYDLTCQTRIQAKAGSLLTASDYIQANKQRTRIIEFLKGLFNDVDAIVMPTAGQCAPPIVDSELSLGTFNTPQDSCNMRYSGLGNLTGCPCISIPVGYNDAGLPVGLQFMTAWWREDLVLKIAEAVERRTQLQKPPIYVDLLDA